MQIPTKNWHQLSVAQPDSGAKWTIIWDTKRRTETEGRNKAVEKFESAALDRAKHLLRMGFVVYEIREPHGSVYLEEAEINRRFAPPTKPARTAPRLPPEDFSSLR